MSSGRSPVVVDTVVFGAGLTARSDPLAERYTPLLLGRRLLIAVQTIAELRFGAAKDGWGADRVQRMEDRIARAAVVPCDDGLARSCAALRLSCYRVGHPLAAKVHSNDMWIAAAAVRFGVPLVSHDSVFQRVPDLELLTAELT